MILQEEEDGPWIVELRIRYEVGLCSMHTAQRAARWEASGKDGESFTKDGGELMPVIERLEYRTEVYPRDAEPFDVD